MAKETIKQWSPIWKKEAELTIDPFASIVNASASPNETMNRGFDLLTDVSPQSPVVKTIQASNYVTYTFYAYTVTAGTQQGIPQTIVIDRDCTCVEVYCQCEVAPGATKATTIDVNLNGTTIFTTQANRPSITGTGKLANGLPNVTAFTNNQQLTMDVDVNTGVAAKLSVYVRCRT